MGFREKIVTLVDKFHIKQGVKRTLYEVRKLFILKRKHKIKVPVEIELGTYQNLSPNVKKTSILSNKRLNNSNDLYDLDIIIPFYNATKYLQQCLMSVTEQKTKYKIRLILIDDGSSDNPETIYSKYLNDSIVLIKQDNKGHSSARNAGLEKLNAKYVMFVDADDYIPRNTIDVLLDNAFKQDADIVQGSYQVVDENNKVLSKKKLSDTVVKNLKEVPGYPWGKVIRSELFNNIQFPEGYWFEDSIMQMIIYRIANKIVTISNNTYYHLKNTQGITQKALNNNKSIDTILILLQLLDDAKQLGIKFDQEYYDYFLLHSIISYKRLRLLERTLREQSFIILCQIKQKYFNDCFTKDKKYKDLERSMLYCNYKLFEVFCECY